MSSATSDAMGSATSGATSGPAPCPTVGIDGDEAAQLAALTEHVRLLLGAMQAAGTVTREIARATRSLQESTDGRADARHHPGAEAASSPATAGHEP